MRLSPAVLVRPATRSDWPRIRELCCLTGDNGAPIERSRWESFGEKWIGPYETLLPEWAFVAETEGEVVGYLTGCPDSAAFRESARPRFQLPQLSVEERFAPATRALLDREFPAHLHVNLEAPARGSGVGKRLLDAFVARLNAEKIPGLHVFCGADPLAYYLKNGFRELDRLETKPGALAHALVRNLEP